MVLRLENASKSFPGVKALNSVSITLEPGEVHALIGENGAGKSTLIKIITGVIRPDSGVITLDNKPVEFHTPRDAIQNGVSAVHQERNLIPRFSVAENIMLERLPEKNGLLDIETMHSEARKHLDRIGLDVDTRAEVRRLSVAQMQLVEIAKALSQRAKVLLLDEPTASITANEAETLFKLISQLQEQRTAIVFVSHKLEEVLQISDRLTVLRDGSNTATNAPMSGIDRDTLVSLMIGRTETIAAKRQSVAQADTKLELKDVSTELGHESINLSVKSREVLGLYGLVGAGRTELAQAIIADAQITGGRILLDGKDVAIASVGQALHTYRIGYLSEDRKGEGLILSHPIRSNVAISIWRQISRWAGFLNSGMELDVVEPLVKRLKIKAPSLEQTVGNLSGGNQQKVSLSRWLAGNVDVLIIDEPTVGVDIKTKAYIHELIGKLAEDGLTILLITSDMPEMIALADRIVVMDCFKVVGEIANSRDYDEVSAQIAFAIHGDGKAGVEKEAV